jgi:integrase
VLSVSKGAEHEGIVRYLSDAERKRSSPHARRATIPTSPPRSRSRSRPARGIGNLRNLTWATSTSSIGACGFAHTKNDQPRFVPLVGRAGNPASALRSRSDAKGMGVQGARRRCAGDLDRAVARGSQGRGLVGEKHCRFHDLRHTTASYLTMNGASLAEVAEALGHRTLTMAKRYSHQSGEHVRSTFERISGRLEGSNNRCLTVSGKRAPSGKWK